MTGSSAANAVAEKADLIIGIGTRFQDFSTGSWGLFKNPVRQILSINIAAYDAGKHNAISLLGDAKVVLTEISAALENHKASLPSSALKSDWIAAVDAATAAPEGNGLPTDPQKTVWSERERLCAVLCSRWITASD